MRRSASISSRAEADLTNQYRWYLDNATIQLAERFLGAFDQTVKRLADMPGIGCPRRFRGRELQGIRSAQVGGTFRALLVFYRVTESGVSIERVMHGARDLERRLRELPENFPGE